MRQILTSSLILFLVMSCTTSIKKKKSGMIKQKDLQIEYLFYDLSNFYNDYSIAKTTYTENKLKIPKKILCIFKKIHFNDFNLYNKNESIPGAINNKGCHDCPNKILNFCTFNDSICLISYVEEPYTEHSVIEFIKFSGKIQHNKINIYENVIDTLMINDLFNNKLHYTPE